MTIAKTGSESSSAGNGIVTAFSFPYRFFADTDLKVYIVVTSTGVSTLQTLTTHYTIVNTETESGGTVTMVTAPASGETLLIQRVLAETQGTDYAANDAFPAQTHENALDKLTLLAQDRVRDHITFPAGDGADPTLETASARASKLQGYDANGALATYSIAPVFTAGEVVFYDTVALLLASTEASRGTGAIWEAGGFRYEEVASGGDVQNAAAPPVHLDVLPNANGRKSINALGPANDGTTDDAAIFATAISIGGEWDGSGEYLIDSAQTGTNAFSLYGDCTIKHNKNAGALAFAPTPSASVSVTSIAANANYPVINNALSTPLTVASTTGLERGQVCMLQSTDVYGYGNATKKTELIRILEIVGTTVYTHGIIEDTYTTGITLTPLSTAEIVIDGPTFEVKEDAYAATGTLGYIGALLIVGAVAPRVTATFRNGLGPGFISMSCWKPVAKVTAEDLRDKSASNVLGYAALASGATNGGIFRVIATRVRHAFTTGDYGGVSDIYEGVPRNNTVSGIASQCTAASWDTHAESHNTTFDGCIAYAGNGDADTTGDLKYGFQSRGRNDKLINPQVRGMSGFYFLYNETWGEDSLTIVDSPDVDTTGQSGSAPYVLAVKGSSDNCIIELRGGRFIGGSPSMGVASPELKLFGVLFTEGSTFRLGQNNKVTMLGVKRINVGSITEGIRVDAGTTLIVDDLFCKSDSFIGASKIILTGPTAGTATIRAGRIVEDIATGGTITFISEETTTLALTYFEQLPHLSKKNTTANRPTLRAVDIGYLYFDTTLVAAGQPIWWTGTGWVDSAGASA